MRDKTSLVVMVDSGTEPYREQPWAEPNPREKCSRGCRNRKLIREQELDYNRWCSECQTWTWDPRNYAIPGPTSWTAAEADRQYLRKEAAKKDEAIKLAREAAAALKAAEVARAKREAERLEARALAALAKRKKRRPKKAPLPVPG